MKFGDIFSSGMVLAKGQPIRIFGKGEGRAELVFAGQRQEIVSQNGMWMATFPAMEYGGPYEIVLKTDQREIVLVDVYVGEVYLMAGQSNMEFKIKEGTDDPVHCESNEMLRLFSTERLEEGDFYTPKHGWVKAEKNMVPEWSALAYYTGLQLAKKKQVAIGVIACYQGASVIESWVPRDLFEQNGICIPLNSRTESHYTGPYSVWNHNGQLYDHMIGQVKPFALSGVVWYQGESDSTVEEAGVYGKELALLIETWRNDFGDSNLPFVIVQIADYDQRDDEGWHMIQKAQYDIQFAMTNVTTVTSADVSQSDNIHPPKKYALSEKICASILEKLY